MKKVFLTAAASFAAIPGIAVIAAGIGTPPNSQVWFGGIVNVVGVGTILLLMMNQKYIRRISPQRLTKYVGILFTSTLMLFISYVVLYNWCVVSHQRWGTVMYPLWATGELARAVEAAGGRWQAFDRYGVNDITSAVLKSSGLIWGVTLGLFVVTYSSMFACLTAAFAILGIKLESHQAKRARRPRPLTKARVDGG
jgi:hypothetical protein